MKRKVRAINKSENDKKKILELHEQNFKPAQIYKHFEGKYSYWQIYNTISPRDAKSTKQVDEEGKLINKKIKADKTVTGMPDIDYSDFPSFERFIEHQITVVVSQLNEKNVTIEKRVRIIKELAKINKEIKMQLIEHHLKNPNARVVISLMRRLKPELTDEQILIIFKEESEKIKKLNK